MAPAAPSKELSSLESTIIGGITGSIAEAVVMPALVIKTRMMAQGADASLTSYRSAAHAASASVPCFICGATFSDRTPNKKSCKFVIFAELTEFASFAESLRILFGRI